MNTQTENTIAKTDSDSLTIEQWRAQRRLIVNIQPAAVMSDAAIRQAVTAGAAVLTLVQAIERLEAYGDRVLDYLRSEAQAKRLSQLDHTERQLLLASAYDELPGARCRLVDADSGRVEGTVGRVR